VSLSLALPFGVGVCVEPNDCLMTHSLSLSLSSCGFVYESNSSGGGGLNLVSCTTEIGRVSRIVLLVVQFHKSSSVLHCNLPLLQNRLSIKERGRFLMDAIKAFSLLQLFIAYREHLGKISLTLNFENFWFRSSGTPIQGSVQSLRDCCCRK